MGKDVQDQLYNVSQRRFKYNIYIYILYRPLPSQLVKGVVLQQSTVSSQIVDGEQIDGPEICTTPTDPHGTCLHTESGYMAGIERP